MRCYENSLLTSEIQIEGITGCVHSSFSLVEVIFLHGVLGDMKLYSQLNIVNGIILGYTSIQPENQPKALAGHKPHPSTGFMAYKTIVKALA